MTRAEKHAALVSLRASGFTIAEAGAVVGLTHSGARNILNDPDGSKQRARRERYRGTCARCGGKTDGSCGYRSCTVHCAACAIIVQHENKRWTREAVIEAIQLWAAEHDGQPPLASEWLHASEDGRFPNRGSVYRNGKNQGHPFAKWADAIEAAGFPRPHVGVYGDRQHWTREKIIFAIQGWAREHGRRPIYADWDYAGDGHPQAHTVVDHFGSWSAAIAIAGFRPYRPLKAAA